MKKLHSFAFYALTTPVITLAAGSVLAQQSAGPDTYGPKHGTQYEQDVMQQSPGTSQSDQNIQRDRGAKYSSPITTEGKQDRVGQSEPQSTIYSRNVSELTGRQNRGFFSSVPDNGVSANNLIGADVKTFVGEDVGKVNDLIIDETGQVVAIVVGTGGFLGIGKRDVAIGWDDVTALVTSDELGSDKLELEIDASHEDLRSAPDFKKRD